MPIVFVFCVIGIIVLGITSFNIIEPFIWQQKLNKIYGYDNIENLENYLRLRLRKF